jgi:hypothetical protein
MDQIDSAKYQLNRTVKNLYMTMQMIGGSIDVSQWNSITGEIKTIGLAIVPEKMSGALIKTLDKDIKKYLIICSSMCIIGCDVHTRTVEDILVVVVRVNKRLDKETNIDYIQFLKFDDHDLMCNTFSLTSKGRFVKIPLF